MNFRARWFFATAFAIALIPPSGLAQSDRPLTPIEIDADDAQPVVAGSLLSEVSRPADRIELVVAISAQADADMNRRASAALLALVRRALPGVAATGQAAPATGQPAMHILGGAPYGGFVRVYVPARLSDAKVRDLVSRIMNAVAAVAEDDAVASASIVSVGRGYDSCSPFESQALTGARSRIDRIARALGSPTPGDALLDATPSRRVAIDGPGFDAPLCGPGDHASGATALDHPTVASFTMLHDVSFAQRLTFAVPPAMRGDAVRGLWTAPTGRIRIRMQTNGPLLTLEGRATPDSRTNGIQYEYAGPNGRYFRNTLTAHHLAQIRERLHALGLSDANVVTQLDPTSGHFYVAVRASGTTVDERIVTAIAGDDAVERGAVVAAAYEDACASEAQTIARAVGEAAARAMRIAASLRTTVDTRPLAVTIGGEADRSCRTSALSAALSSGGKTLGMLRTVRDTAGSELSVFATFRIGDPMLAGGNLTGEPATNVPSSYAATYGYVPPPFDYPAASRSGDARRQIRLRPQTVAVSLALSPDNANHFRPIDRAIVPTLAAELGASEREYAASFTPGQYNLPSGERLPASLNFIADLPYRGAALERALDRAMQSFRPVGYGGFNVVPERRDCDRAADLLARDAIRAAAARARAPRGARLVAIDLRGPFTVDGTCSAGSAAAENFSVRHVSIPDVRIAAYARVSYAR